MKTFSAILLAALLVPVAARSEAVPGETEWMGEARQWAVGFVGEKPSYCRLVWDDELGKTVEFRQSLDNVMWLVSKDGWDIPAGTATKVTLVGYSGTKAVAAEAFDGKTLRILPADGKTGVAQIKKILKNSFVGTPDMELDFSGNEEKWVVPLSRLQQMYTTYVNCLNRLVPANQARPVSDKTQPF
ncbi:hypothetical protein [Rhizobium sp. GCM10022189]|jgi:hypothetical protein|uniref:hypothetical protein n=1 Tax=Rhizobium sp. GCM10022189 TaxID=3252654 RepID=UPI000DDAD9B6